ncbi:hypothetical protein OSTOST_23277, partial [Ostertagia ostertagi]
VDETCIVRRKYNVGCIVRKDWLVGGIQDGTKLVFVEITDDRSSATLDAIIQKYVRPGGVVRTDMWRGYNNLTNLGHKHETVNHSANFVNLATGVHTAHRELLGIHFLVELGVHDKEAPPNSMPLNYPIGRGDSRGGQADKSTPGYLYEPSFCAYAKHLLYDVS